ncbi:hypothetical protein Zm00014a_002946 [Zea mays]|uniref:Uncharacterized protein n=1 Tax=Zea mays TaxID=4577 RepID=A0A317YCW4_MAIZE|nr:hypothetical protein Zm00014a_002946 [Zea mays]
MESDQWCGIFNPSPSREILRECNRVAHELVQLDRCAKCRAVWPPQAPVCITKLLAVFSDRPLIMINRPIVTVKLISGNDVIRATRNLIVRLNHGRSICLDWNLEILAQRSSP